jgi:hypothetical protein
MNCAPTKNGCAFKVLAHRRDGSRDFFFAIQPLNLATAGALAIFAIPIGISDHLIYQDLSDWT